MKKKYLNYRYPEDICEKLEFLKSKGLGKEYIANRALREYFDNHPILLEGIEAWKKETIE